MDTGAFPVSPYRRILFCTDFSENADYAFDFAVDSSRAPAGQTEPRHGRIDGVQAPPAR